MFESDDELESREEQEKTLKSTLSRYDEMVRKRQNYFFDVDILIRMVDHHIEGGNFDKAGEVAAFGTQLHPFSPNLLIKMAHLDALSGRFEAALTQLEEVERISPNDADVYVIRGNVYTTMDRHQEAIACFRKALEHADTRDDIFLGLGITYQSMHEYDLAIKYFIRAIRENAFCEPAYEQLCLCYANTDRIEDGIRYLNRLIDNDPYSWLAWYNLGDLYAKLNLFEKAHQSLDYCLAIKEDYFPAYIDCASVLSHLGRYRDAIEKIEQTFEFTVPDAYAFFSMAECYEKLEEMEEARTYYKKAARLMPGFADAWYGIALTLECEERWKEMLHFAKKALTLEKDNSDYLLLVADAHCNLKELAEAEDYYKQAVEADSEHTDAWTGYLAFLENNGRGGEALTLNQQAVVFNPECSELILRLVCNLYLQGKLNQSYELFEEVLQKDPHAGHQVFELVPALRNDPAVTELMARYGK